MARRWWRKLDTTFVDLLEPLEITTRQTMPPQITESVAAASNRIAGAKEEALRIKRDAEQKAGELLGNARTQAESLREAALKEGYQAGETAGYAAAVEDCVQRTQVHSDALRAEVQAVVDQITNEWANVWLQQEGEMVAFVLDIAKKVIKTELSQNQDVVIEIIKNCLKRVTDKENVRIRVSVSDAPHVKEMRDEILSVIDGLRHLEIIDDRRIGDGGCVIETNAGTIDARISTQISEIERTLEVTNDD